MGTGHDIPTALLLRRYERWDTGRLIRRARAWGQIHDTRIVDHERLAPIIKYMSPGISTRPPTEHSQFIRARIILVDPAIEIAHDPMLGFYLSVEKDAFLEVNPPARTAPPSADRVVVVLNSESC